jgi:hypothetical protein
MKDKQNIEKIIKECGYTCEDSKDIEKILSVSIDKKPDFDLDEKIKKYAGKVHQPKKLPLLFKWAIPAVLTLLIAAVVICVNFKPGVANSSNDLKIKPKVVSIGKIENIDVELALLDIEIGMTEYELQKDNLQNSNKVNSANKIDTTYKMHNVKVTNKLYTI